MEVHKWMDDPSWGLRRKHRKYRHNILETPKEALNRFGLGADLACIDHILLDYSKIFPDLTMEEIYRILINKEKLKILRLEENIKLIKEVNK
jgi:hypothetical protein